MGELVLCEVCKQPQKDPVIVPCCAMSMCAVHVNMDCPGCEGHIESQLVKRNVLLMSLLGAAPLCQRCDSGPAQLHCSQCNVTLCKDCCALIHSQGAYRKHVYLSIPLPATWDECDLHPGVPLTHFCTEDWITLCTECLKTHTNHPVLRIESLKEDTLREISAKESHIKEMLRLANDHCSQLAVKNSELNAAAEKTKSQVKSLIQSLKDALNAKEEELLKGINARLMVKNRELGKCMKDGLAVRHRLEAVLGLLSFAKTQPASVLVDSLKYLSSILDKIPENNKESFHVNASFVMGVNGGKVVEMIQSISLEERENGGKSLRLSSSRGSAPDLNSEQKVQGKGSKSPIGRSSMTLRETPMSPTRAGRVNITPRTGIRGNSGSKSFEDGKTGNDDPPLSQRTFIKKAQSSSAIQVSWNHPSSLPSPIQYTLEYGVGIKVGNIEQFRPVYKGSARTCIITDLLPKTAYRFRVAPLSVTPEVMGEWSEVATITTFDQQSIDPQSCGQHAVWTVRGPDKFLLFEKAGIVTALNPVLFGKVAWEIRIVSSGLFSQDDSPSALKVGVLVGRTKLVTGSTVIYSGKPAAKVKICLDADNRCMTCFTPTHPQGETYQHLAEGPLLPAFMNKPGKMGGGSVKIWVNFEAQYEEGE